MVDLRLCDIRSTLLQARTQPVYAFRRAISTLVTPLSNRWFRFRHGDGIDVVGQDWDTLILLDACRYDTFAAENTIPGNLTRVVSRGNYSWPFMRENFANRDLTDTVYITANPYADRLPDNTFHAVNLLLDEWNEEIGTIHPDAVVKAAKQAHDRYPEKRIIVHFMQPHQPFLGETADRVRNRIDTRGWDRYDHLPDKSAGSSGITWWAGVRSGDITLEETRTAYRETLQIALHSTSEIIKNIEGKVVVTSDHGEFLGERIAPLTHRRFGHPDDVHASEVCLVPWLEASFDSRRTVKSDAPKENTSIETDEVSKRLNALGYTE